MNEKIRPEHLQRAAYLYLRQSTAHQVRFPAGRRGIRVPDSDLIPRSPRRDHG